MEGAFITIYGINNIGKSTHAKKLVERLCGEGFDAVYLKYPIYDCEPTGSRINSVLRGGVKQSISEEELQTLFTQNRKDFEPTLKKYLSEGKIVVAEDYAGTGIAWGTAKGLDLEWIEKLNADCLKEDFTILMEGKRDFSAKEKTHIHESDDALVNKVDEILHMLGEKYGWKKVMVQERIEDTANHIWEEVKTFLEARK